MAHSLIVGMTESGKTTLAKILCSRLKKRGILTAVLDPLKDNGWHADFVTDNVEAFNTYCKANKSHVLFIDEGGLTVGRYDTEMQWYATMSRHWGHSCYFISQGVTQLAPIIRQQASKYYVFACGESNTRLIAEECREPDLKECSRIGKGEFFIVSRFENMKRARIEYPTKGRVAIDKLTVTVYKGDEPTTISQSTKDEATHVQQ